MVTVYGDDRSGNCLKVRWILDLREVPYAWHAVDLSRGETRTEQFLEINPAGQVPAVDLGDGRHLAQSNAIVLHFAEGSRLIPDGPFERAKMLEWLFWEQYSHEPYIAVRRFQMLYQGRQAAELDPLLFDRGCRALGIMEQALSVKPFLVGDSFSAADLCLLAYTRLAGEGGFELSDFPHVTDWILRSEGELGLSGNTKAAGG